MSTTIRAFLSTRILSEPPTAPVVMEHEDSRRARMHAEWAPWGDFDETELDSLAFAQCCYSPSGQGVNARAFGAWKYRRMGAW